MVLIFETLQGADSTKEVFEAVAGYVAEAEFNVCDLGIIARFVL